ncbi:uroporphyrinogen decarboxylase family protein [Akkermansia sp. N21169]|jgi:uroporphyrinogen decarboxylase|uniref:uroporphyrinogen decarboxylase family protein n=1 Tax=Akkermansia sp. N21169 TaxID=3040765 RepID=UPI00244EAB3C|nr:uroporphyrinogen decarboxylase family protein [Akkermansia sp. N21169]MDH3068199.1 uroporphyrinogen decarboxylase family protein [Akkermansia sp. N21169]
MNSKARLIHAINFRETDRPPVFCSIVPQLADKLGSYFGMAVEAPIDSPMSSNRISWMDLMLRLGSDCVCVASCAPDTAPTRTLDDGLMVNEWGIGMRNHGLYDDFELHPLAHVETVEDVEAFPFPDPDAPGRFRLAQEAIEKYGKDYGIIGDLECSIFETSWYLVGLEKLFMGMAMEEPWVDALFDKVAAFHIRVGCTLAALGADVIWCGDDIGSQNGPMISVEMFDRYFFPRIRTMFAEFKKVKPDVKIAWHSCGSILPFIPRFIEAGLDILNPIQPLAAGMDPVWLKETYGDRLVFFGGICVQELLPHGTTTQVKEEVLRRIAILAKGGGYILAPAHNIQADTPIENILAMFEAVRSLEQVH